jgi:hypothetical protein
MNTFRFLTLALTALLAFASTAFGYTVTEQYKVSDPAAKLQEAAKQGLGISRTEKSEKREVRAWKNKNATKYDRLQIAPNNHVNEIQEGLGMVEPRKVLAKYYLKKHVESKWSHLRNTVFLDNPADNWKEAEKFINLELEKITFVPTPSKSHYRFETTWGFALVKRDMSHVETGITIADHLDGNKLPEGAENIRIPEDK